ncbi:MAG: transposase [candidate division Zixibacteria bacterium]|nr:transposase [candidate division Zixibacteria bacterium]
MSILKRYDPLNRPVFLTCVTLDRQPLLVDLIHPLIAAYRHVLNLGVIVPAWVILPDHLHAVIDLGEGSLSDTVHRFKRKLSAVSYGRNHTGRLWQHRFWDHIIRDQADYNRHIDYTHFNPVKHGVSVEPAGWKWSSIHRWMAEGWYQPDWGRVEREDDGVFGE